MQLVECHHALAVHHMGIFYHLGGRESVRNEIIRERERERERENMFT
jgi:hypothetical protein